MNDDGTALVEDEYEYEYDENETEVGAVFNAKKHPVKSLLLHSLILVADFSRGSRPLVSKHRHQAQHSRYLQIQQDLEEG
jgi:hypothetical protein